jgi:hypothetical protein
VRAIMRNPAAGFVCLAVFIVVATASEAAPVPLPDVALITGLSGETTYWNKADIPKPTQARSFMKVRDGDHFKLASAASLTLLYFASGRQETWKGPATLMACGQESLVLGNKQPMPRPVVKIFPTTASRQLGVAPLPLCPANMSKSGVLQTMGSKDEPAAKIPPPLSDEARKKIKEAEKIYRNLERSAVADDVTPELYFFSVLAEYWQFPEMAKIVDAMVVKRPGDPALKDLRSWVRSQRSAGD